MASKKILGLDLGTNSIGWALVEGDIENRKGNIVDLGVRIIPMSQEILGDFEKGSSISQTSERTRLRGVRRLLERTKLRRERLHRVLNILGYLPDHYNNSIDFENRLGQFIEGLEVKLPFKPKLNGEGFEFLFFDSYNEMLEDFKKNQPDLLIGKDGKDLNVPYDWTIYYLRQKAISKQISKFELAWLLLHFNQKRGYYQLRGEEEDTIQNKLVEFHSLEVQNVEKLNELNARKENLYKIELSNGWSFIKPSSVPVDWKGKVKEFIISTELNDDGTIKLNKEGKEKRTFRAPDESDWTLIKKKTEFDIEKSNQTVGQYIYTHLLKNPGQKIKGKLVRTIERKYYKEELKQILQSQIKFHVELQDKSLFEKSLFELYKFNEPHRNTIINKGFEHLILNDILFYQRPLKSKKSQISTCTLESKYYLKNGEKIKVQINCIPKSHPDFQEFRLWQFIQNIRIYAKQKEVNGKLLNDVDVTSEFLKSEDDYCKLFDVLNSKVDIDQKEFLSIPFFGLKKEKSFYRWNYVEDKKYPCNETRANILIKLNKLGLSEESLSNDLLFNLWHILYSVEDKYEIELALQKFVAKNSFDSKFVQEFKKYPTIKKEYGSFSKKAINKLLPLMRMGKYWNVEAIIAATKERIDKIINGEYDPRIANRVREKAINLNKIEDFKSLPLWLSSYIIYNRHSEDADAFKWKTSSDVNGFLNSFKQHSLRNPIVEQLINESLRVVKDIWDHYGKGEENFFDEIHIELGRDMKNPKDKRERISKQQTENENTNLRLKALLMELLNDPEIQNVRPHSPNQLEILKLYEEGALNSVGLIPDDIAKISKLPSPGKTELTKYKLWLNQQYRSPYTGAVIPLAKLFTSAYQIEHIIPQSRFFDDSIMNKVICEAEVNQDKGAMTAYEYIKNCRGKILELSNKNVVKVLSIEEYEDLVKNSFSKTPSKQKRLLMEDIPDSFIERQINDTRYISKYVKNLLSNIVREDDERETSSKNLISSNGTITSTLKQDWGLNEVWNDIITPRFIRLNEMTNSNDFGNWTLKEGKKVFQTQVPLNLQKGFNKKRIDHRHHALDALVVACASRSHINYLNNSYAKSKQNELRFDLRNTLCYKKYNTEEKDNYKWMFYTPWDNFTLDAKLKLDKVIVSFKQNLRVINKTVNSYQKWIDRDGLMVKQFAKQKSGDNWAIRKSMHKDTVSGEVSLKFKKEVSFSNALDSIDLIVNRRLKKYIQNLIKDGFDKKKILKHFKDLDNEFENTTITKLEIYYFENDLVASRSLLTEDFNSKKIQSITDSGIRKILAKHLANYTTEDGKEHPELAFSSDGLDDLNKNLNELNGGKSHAPIYKVRVFESKGNKFQVGYKGNKAKKFVEAAKGTNLFFAIYVDENGKRSFETIPLNIVIERQKQGLSSVPEINSVGHNLLFTLSPNDIVYIEFDGKVEYYKFVSCTESEGHFVPNFYSTAIVKNEMGTNNKSQNSITGIQIKSKCEKVKLNRLGRT